MAYLVRKKIRKHFYYYLVERQRVEGKIKTVSQVYLGRVEKVLERLKAPQSPPSHPKKVRSLDFGDCLALYEIARELDIVRIINAHVKKRHQGVSVGEYLLLVALNRALDPASKQGMARWYRKTVLPELLKVPPVLLKSQNFWDHMDYLEDAPTIEAIEWELGQRLLERYSLSFSMLLYDTTNFFTYLEGFRSQLAKRGKNKAGRHNLRRVNLALLVTRDFGIPLLHLLYEGNLNDVSSFPMATEKILERFKVLVERLEDLTLVFDKGNNSEDNLKELDEAGFRVVGSLHPSRYGYLLSISLERFIETLKGGLKAYRTQAEALGRERTVVITYSEKLARKKLLRLDELLTKARTEIAALKGKLNQGKWKTKEAVEKKVQEILSHPEIKGLLAPKVSRDGAKRMRLSVRQDPSAMRSRKNAFGKTILFTSRHEWSTQQIVSAYHGKNAVEEDFKTMKSHETVRFVPMYHWTDQKIRVHTFCCILALLMLNLLHRKVSQGGISLSPGALRESLQGIKRVDFSYPGSPEIIHEITELDEDQRKLFNFLGFHRYVEC